MFVLRLDNIVLRSKSISLQVDSLKSQHGDLEKQLESLKLASEPKRDEVDRVKQLEKIVSAKQEEIDRLTQGSKKLKAKVMWFCSLYKHLSCSFLVSRIAKFFLTYSSNFVGNRASEQNRECRW